jgi:hypothetical protein
MPNVADVIAFEEGELTEEEAVEFIGGLLKSGMAWRLQGYYGRMAVSMIEAGLLSEDGDVLV